MNPNALIFPRINVKTGAANFKNVRELISSGAAFVIHRGCRPSEDPFDNNFLRDGPIMATVPAHCAATVAMAAPFNAI
jgi:hypothetical protein